MKIKLSKLQTTSHANQLGELCTIHPILHCTATTSALQSCPPSDCNLFARGWLPTLRRLSPQSSLIAAKEQQDEFSVHDKETCLFWASVTAKYVAHTRLCPSSSPPRCHGWVVLPESGARSTPRSKEEDTSQKIALPPW